MIAEGYRIQGQQRPKQRLAGFTLIEVVISIVILGIALTAIVSAISLSTGRSAEALVQNRSIQLAQAYLEEILTKRFDDATGISGVPPVTTCNIAAEAGESRATFDDVDDYHGINDKPPISQTGTSFSNYTNYRVQVAVTCAGAAGDLGVNANMAKRITITVTDPENGQMQFSAYKGNY